MSERLQKVLANAGYASRREIEKWIDAGRISVNAKRAKLGDRVDSNDFIRLDGKPVRLGPQHNEQIKALVYHKPEGQICSRKDEKGRPTVFDGLPSIANGRWVAVGRLDVNTSGLLLFTNSGDLANRLMHPSTGLEREYLVRVRGQASDATITTLVKTGVELDGKKAFFDSVTPADMGEEGTNHWYRVVIKEGRYREVRRLWDAVGHTVSRLKRIRYGSIKLTRDIKLGKYSKIAPKQLEKLVSSVGLNAEFATQLYSYQHSRAGQSPRKQVQSQVQDKAQNQGQNKAPSKRGAANKRSIRTTNDVPNDRASKARPRRFK